ncbi:uncharacterized protein LOC114730704 [Neltuma alba]|uniref:uncharacterized protein LOC114730704 n=1 Tax=Neltuma alba TaxID=207710 RepID=UPI0010A39672|nr:uncharacterized protein LOC114730704 [Prosopis alba]
MPSVEARRSSFSEASELFEFFNDVALDLCPADDIFFRGKLEPFNHRPHSDSPSVDHRPVRESNIPPNPRLRSDSISGVRFHVSRSNSVGTSSNSPRSVMMRNSRSLDCRKLRRSSSSVVFMAPEVERNSSTVKRATSKARWCSVMLGTVKPPTEMELSDMKNRQARRNPSRRMFPAVIEGGGKMAENRSSAKCSWRILRALTCRDRRSVSVTTSLAVPQAT